jgi:hypothetical protein
MSRATPQRNPLTAGSFLLAASAIYQPEQKFITIWAKFSELPMDLRQRSG